MKRLALSALLGVLLALSACHAGKTSETAASAGAQQVITRQVDYSSGTTPLKGYLAYPASDEKRPAVLIVHEWWGLNDYVKKRAEQLAAEGYVAFAIDMFGEGKHTAHPEEAKQFMMAAISNLDEAQKRFHAAQELVANDPHTDATKLAAIGYCFGGATVLHMARFGDNQLKLVASFHGNLATQQPMAKGAFQGKIFVAQGGADPFVPAEQLQKFKAEMDAAAADYEVIEYPGAKHAFTNPDATAAGQKHGLPLAYDATADAQSWAQLKQLLEAL